MLRADAAPAPASQVRTMRPAGSAGTRQRKRTSPGLGLGRGSENANRGTPGGAGTPVGVTASTLSTSTGEPGWRAVSEISPDALAENGTSASPCASVVAVAIPSAARYAVTPRQAQL